MAVEILADPHRSGPDIADSTDRPFARVRASSGWFALTGIIVSALLTGFGWKVASDREFERNRAEFAAIAHDNEEALFHRVATFRTALDGAAALYISRDQVTFAEWTDYVSTLDLEKSLRGLNGIGFIRSVKQEDKEHFLRVARMRGAPITDIHPASQREELFPIKYIAPLAQNRPAIGLDLAFEEHRRQALVASRASGKLTITKPISLVQDKTRSPGFLLVRPIYRDGAPIATRAERLVAFEAWSYAPIVARDFLADLTPRQGRAFDLYIYQGNNADIRNLIYSSAKPSGEAAPPLFVHRAQLEIAGEPWLLEWRSLPEFEQTVKSDEPLLVLLGGIAISLCLGALLVSVSRRESRVRREVAEATRELAARDRERSAMLGDLRRARDDSLAAVKAKSTFLANMSHELRTPMNGVLGFADLLVRSDLKPEARRHAELIAESGRVMARLLDDILDLSRIEAGKMVIAHESVDPKQVCKQVMQLVEPAAREKGLQISVKLGESVPHLIVGDKLRIQQILINLVGNAVKFTDNGFVSVALERANEDLVFSVRDSGVGIEPAKLEAIFDDFVQADDSDSRQRGGTGLGLAISRKLARAMGGTLSATSRAGAGSTFTLTLPLRVAASRSVERQRPAIRAIRQNRRAHHEARILMAEDNDINRMLMEAMGQEVGITLDCAFDGKQAVAMIEHAALNDMPYQLVLMDVQMPVMDGIEAATILREKGFDARELPIIALTANAFAEDVERCLGSGMQAHYAKPLTLEKFRDLLGRWLPDPDGEDRAAA